VLFGGRNTGYLADTWEFDGNSWLPIATAVAPPAGYGHALAYDGARGRTFLLEMGAGGGSATWEFDGSNWTQVVTVASPPASTNFVLGYDSARGRAVHFGGWRRGPLDETWELLPARAATWTRHGRGCAGSAGVPSLDGTGALPALGTTFPLRFAQLPALPGALLLALGAGIAQWNGTALPADLGAYGLPGCKLWIEPGAGLLIGHPGGSTSHPVPIPGSTLLAGQLIATQALVFDVAAANGIGAVTNAGVMRLY
jgi:hypothetical protein